MASTPHLSPLTALPGTVPPGTTAPGKTAAPAFPSVPLPRPSDDPGGLPTSTLQGELLRGQTIGFTRPGFLATTAVHSRSRGVDSAPPTLAHAGLLLTEEKVRGRWVGLGPRTQLGL